MKNCFAAIGECMIELSYRSSRELHMGFAGDTLNTAVYFSRCCDLNNTSVEYITALGSDPYSSMMMEDWKKEGIGCQYTRIIPEKLPGLYLIQVDASGERSFYYYRSNSAAKQMFLGEEGRQLASRLVDFTIIYFSGITLAILDASSRDRFYKALKQSKDNGVMIAFDTNYRSSLWNSFQEAKEVVEQFCHLVSMALPSYDDETLLFGDNSMINCANRYHDYGVNEVIVRQGKEGCLLSKEGKQIQVPALSVANIVDTTAAGDSFNGAYLAYRVRNYSPEKAAKKAMEVAATVIQYPGGIIPKEAMPK